MGMRPKSACPPVPGPGSGTDAFHKKVSEQLPQELAYVCWDHPSHLLVWIHKAPSMGLSCPGAWANRMEGAFCSLGPSSDSSPRRETRRQRERMWRLKIFLDSEPNCARSGVLNVVNPLISSDINWLSVTCHKWVQLTHSFLRRIYCPRFASWVSAAEVIRNWTLQLLLWTHQSFLMLNMLFLFCDFILRLIKWHLPSASNVYNCILRRNSWWRERFNI